ncbi:CaiB/BaiF CoA transferase family protein [Cupriavidus basilensis]|uniref:CAIB/BAIF family protein n=1 Tax=Cupriavidus basilensis TaxID=68895 RepID=A0A0C4YK28_9BURK|nr:CoA transferase [Cupriavidus basilensis]AJG22314.1 CAIB/BAIF family protein [Cupriavidus basilensis]
MSTAGFGALDGVRVIDMTQMLAGPFSTQLLADHGAEVIKIEPVDGEGSRKTGPFCDDDLRREFGGYFASVNRNKKSIALDLKQPDAREALLRLTDRADVLVENYRAGVMDRLNLGYEVLRARNPKLIYAAIRGFGDGRTGKSPYVDWPAFDVVAQAMGGLMGINGPDAATPMKVGPGVGDLVPAMLCAFGIVSALHSATKTGEGQFVDVAMADSVLALCERIIHQKSFQNLTPHPEGNKHPLLAPFGMFRAQDGFITLAAHTDAWWRVLCRLISREDLIVDSRTATADARIKNRDFLYAEVERFTSHKTKRQLLELLGGKLPFGPVYDVDEILADPHFTHREMIVEVPHPGVERNVRIAGIPVKMSATPGKVHTRAPLLGEHTDLLLREIGYADTEIRALRELRTIA